MNLNFCCYCCNWFSIVGRDYARIILFLSFLLNFVLDANKYTVFQVMGVELGRLAMSVGSGGGRGCSNLRLIVVSLWPVSLSDMI